MMATKKETKLRIAILDDYPNVSAPYFEKYKADGLEVVSFPDTLLPYNHRDTPESAKDALVKRLEPFNVISTMRERTPFPRGLVQKLPNLQLILTTGRRNLALDLDACEEHSVKVLTAHHVPPPGENRVDSTTEHIVAMILGLARNLAEDDLGVKTGSWQNNICTGLSGKTLGLVGLGRLGGAMARIFHVAFGMRIIAWSQNLSQEAADRRAQEFHLPTHNSSTGEPTFKYVSRDELFRTSDVVSLHVVLSSRTEGFITADDLNKMKPASLFVNSSRGPLVKEIDLLEVLREGKIRGAALDVFGIEPLPADSEWRSTEWGKQGRSHVLLTPHTGYVEEEALNLWYKEQVDALDSWIAGEEWSYCLV